MAQWCYRVWHMCAMVAELEGVSSLTQSVSNGTRRGMRAAKQLSCLDVGHKMGCDGVGVVNFTIDTAVVDRTSWSTWRVARGALREIGERNGKAQETAPIVGHAGSR